MKKEAKVLLIWLMAITMLTGCSSQTVYEFAKAETNRTIYSQLMEGLTPVQFLAVGFLLYVSKYVFVIAIFSIILGFVILFSIKNSPRIRKKAVAGLIIGMPLIIICLYVLAKMIAATANV